MGLKRPLLVAFVFTLGLIVQTSTGRITGTITDPSGAAVKSADVTVVNERTNEERQLRFVGPAMAFSMAGNMPAAFDSFMQGICGQHYRGTLERALTPAGLEKAISQSGYFFRDEAPAAMQWQLRPEEAQKLILPVLVVEGANGRAEGMLSQQVTEVAVRLFPSSELALIDGANHMVPLQQPHWAMQSPTSSSGTQWPAPPSRLVR